MSRSDHMWFVAAAVILAGYSLSAAEPLTIEARSITSFDPSNGEQTRFGELEFIGGLELTSQRDDFGGLSSLGFFDDGRRVIMTSDTGFWLIATPRRQADGRIVALKAAAMTAMRGANGAELAGKWQSDAEGIAVAGDIFVAFERINRINRYRLAADGSVGPAQMVELAFDPKSLRSNKGLEALAVASENGPLAGGVLAFSERSLDQNGNMRAFIVSGPLAGEFAIERIEDFDITGADFLPGGDLLLLERRYELASGVAMRIRRFAATDIKPGAILAGEVLLKTDDRRQIDNMEGLAVSHAADGATILSLISDDNHSLLQRTLLLQFRIQE